LYYRLSPLQTNLVVSCLFDRGSAFFDSDTLVGVRRCAGGNSALHCTAFAAAEGGNFAPTSQLGRGGCRFETNVDSHSNVRVRAGDGAGTW
jgi:hypothetical protein